jgi:hypothetical protein
MSPTAKRGLAYAFFAVSFARVRVRPPLQFRSTFKFQLNTCGLRSEENRSAFAEVLAVDALIREIEDVVRRVAAAARKNGIAPDRLLLETKARNTYENAVFTQQLIAPLAEERWLLVTSAVHMPRAVGCFRRAGFTVLPWPVTMSAERSAGWMEFAKHEWVGLLVYRFLGRTDSLFPGPDAQQQPWSVGSLGSGRESSSLASHLAAAIAKYGATGYRILGIDNLRVAIGPQGR